MPNYDFWKKWTKKTLIEKNAIKSVINARQYIIAAVPKDKLISIYIKGSFVRREMNKTSDVDMVPIVSENKYQARIFNINNKAIKPVIVVPLSIWELKNNKLWTKFEQPRWANKRWKPRKPQ